MMLIKAPLIAASIVLNVAGLITLAAGILMAAIGAAAVDQLVSPR